MYTLLVGRPPFETKDVKMTYRRIKMNLYVFPDTVSISDEAKSLINSILVVDHTKRPTFDSILSHEFFNKNVIPRFLPVSTLAVPPNQVYMKQFLYNKDLENEKIVARASSEESQKDLDEVKSPRKRNFSRENKKDPCPHKIQPFETGYKEIDQNGPDI